MKRVFPLIIMVLMLISAFPSQVMAETEDLYPLFNKGLFSGRFILKHKKSLALTPGQENKIESKKTVYKEAAIRGSSEIKMEEFQLAGMIKSGKTSRLEIEKMIRKISKKKSALIIDRFNYLLDLRDILTTEQVEKLKAVAQENRRKRE